MTGRPRRYDPTSPVRTGDSMRARIVAVIRMDDDWAGARGDNAMIAEMFGCAAQYVSSARSALRRGAIGAIGAPVWPQPGAITDRLIELERTRPGLSRRAQAEILGTTVGMVIDTACRIRRRDPTLAPPRRRGANPSRLRR